MIKKNNKGFTLIEVIAVVALLGILSILVVPRIFDLITNSRNDVYIEDALRLIAQARYTMSSKSVKIEKPDSGEVIIFSMKYLSSGDFQHPPNGGSYMTESSFVVVKNVGGDYVFSTMLVEEIPKKGTDSKDYIGVELTTENGLKAKDANKHVRAFTREEIVTFDSNSGQFLDAAYIKDHLNTVGSDADWDIDDIIGYYNNEIDDPDVVTDTNSPKVTAKFSTSGSLETVLSVYASDADNDTRDLKVFVKVSRSGSDSYPNPKEDTNLGESYGDGGFYTKNINFRDYGFTYNFDENDPNAKSTAYVYILVADPNDNYTRKRMTYEIHRNEPPKIKNLRISPSNESYTGSARDKNMPKAKVTLDVTDDMDQHEDLLICLVQDKKTTECDNEFKKYSELFGGTGSYVYTFTNNGQTINEPDGSEHTLTVIVKDSSDAITTQMLDYKLYLNDVPKVNFSGFTPRNAVEPCSGSCNALTAKVNLSVEDDLTDAYDLKVKMYYKENGEERGVIETTYGQFVNSDQTYTFGGDYDGNNRELFVTVKDQYNKATTVSKTLNRIYKDKNPSLYVTSGSFVTSAENACNGLTTCNNTNSYHVNLNFAVSDDLTPVGQLKVCLSETKANCKLEKVGTDSFKNYADIDHSFTFSHSGVSEDALYPDPAITKYLYAAVVDGKGNYYAYNNLNPVEYTLYSNDDPSFSGSFSINSTNDNRSLTSVQVSASRLNVNDDFNDYTVAYCYKIDRSEDEICTDYKDYGSLKDTLSSRFIYKDKEGNQLDYDGQTITSFFKVKDNYGKIANSSTLDYQLFTDQNPAVSKFEIKSINNHFNHNTFKAIFKVVDYEDKYSVCIGNDTRSSQCTEYSELFDGNYNTEHTIEIDGAERFGWSQNYTESELEKTLYLFVKDTHDNVVSSSEPYTLYKLCSYTDELQPTNTPPTFEYDSNTRISPDACQGKCYHAFSNTSDRNHVNYFQRTNDIFGTYKMTKEHLDPNVDYTCPVVTSVDKNCNYVDCFATGSATSVNPNLISLDLIDKNSVWYYTNANVKRNVIVDKPYCENYPDNTYFYNNDERCDNVDTICDDRAETLCDSLVSARERHDNDVINTLNANYEQALATYNENYKTAVIDAMKLLYQDKDNYESVLKAKIEQNAANDDWLMLIGSTCQNPDKCQECMDASEGELPIGCDIFQGLDPLSCTAFVQETEIDNICDLVDSIVNYRTEYYASHSLPQKPIIVTLDEFHQYYEPQGYTIDQVHIRYDKATDKADCKGEQITKCSSFYSFCDETSVSTYKQLTPCDDSDSTQLSAYCSVGSYSAGYCLTNDKMLSVDGTEIKETECAEGVAGCGKVCYKNVSCNDEFEKRPVVFTCHGYYETYQSTRSNGNIVLQKTPIRICPDFYRLFPGFYRYVEGSDKAYIEFSKEEQTAR